MLRTSMMVLLVLVCTAGLGFAGNGQGGNKGSWGGGNGLHDGTGPIHDIFAGTPFDLTGDVVSIVSGQGLELAAEDSTYTIYGIGPDWYWEAQDAYRPVVGDTITVYGFVVDYNGVERYIATIITVGGMDVQLRDLETGAPLWRGGRGGGK